MAPESRPRIASEREDKQQLANNVVTGFPAGREKETFDQVNNALDQQMAVDNLHKDLKKLVMQDSEQHAEGK